MPPENNASLGIGPLSSLVRLFEGAPLSFTLRRRSELKASPIWRHRSLRVLKIFFFYFLIQLKWTMNHFWIINNCAFVRVWTCVHRSSTKICCRCAIWRFIENHWRLFCLCTPSRKVFIPSQGGRSRDSFILDGVSYNAWPITLSISMAAVKRLIDVT